uniref:Lactadherin-like n=1 Tax=Phallusia mammillata TaxID=59560 RepID=A0A6F9DK19_9ASCI|nr:lactadherin-like [Phallusia mammillata]
MRPYETTWQTVKDASGQDDNFYGNSDSDTEVTNMFYRPIVAIKLRLVAQQWHNYISLRHEYLTC